MLFYSFFQVHARFIFKLKVHARVLQKKKVHARIPLICIEM